MQNTLENYQPLTQAETKISWHYLWKNHWRYSHWLISSAVTTMICSEFYNIVITLYPNFFLNFYASIGLQSLFITNILTCTGILGLGLLTGWLFYSAHLALISIKMSYQTLAPVLKLWQNSPDMTIFLNDLLSKEHFLKLSEFLAETKLPQGFKQFINQKQNSADILHIFDILTQLWAIQSPDDKIKQLTLKILNDWQFDKDFKVQIEKIASLTQLLTKINHINDELFQLAITEHEKLEPHLSLLNQVTEEQDLLSLIIEHPQILPYYRAYRELSHVKTGTSILNPEDFCRSLIHPQGEIDQWLHQHFYQYPEQYATLWHLCNSQANSRFLEPIIHCMTHAPSYSPKIQNFNFCESLITAFGDIEIDTGPISQDFYKNLELMTSEFNIEEFCSILIFLENVKFLQADTLVEVILCGQLDEVKKILLQEKKLDKKDLLRQLSSSRNIIQLSRQNTDLELVRTVETPPRRSWTNFFRRVSCHSQVDVLPQLAKKNGTSNPY